MRKAFWCLIKFFAEERHADQFMAGDLHLNTLAYFKRAEAEDSDGRMDATEGVSMWWQPHDLVVTFDFPGFGHVEITKADLAGPVSMTFNFRNNLHLFCVNAVLATGFEFIDGRIEFTQEQADELQRQLHIDDRCMKFGKFAVIMLYALFVARLREALDSQLHKARWKLVEYYDEDMFHGEIPLEEIPFRKQKRFSYQREFRLCVYPRTEEETSNSDPIMIHIGDIPTSAARWRRHELTAFSCWTPNQRLPHERRQSAASLAAMRDG